MNIGVRGWIDKMYGSTGRSHDVTSPLKSLEVDAFFARRDLEGRPRSSD